MFYITCTNIVYDINVHKWVHTCSNVHMMHMYLHMYTNSIEYCEGTCTYAHTYSSYSMISGSQKKCQEKP